MKSPKNSIHSLFTTEVLHQPSALPTKLIKSLKTEALMLAQKDFDGLKWSQKNYPAGFTSYGSLNQLHLFSEPFIQLHKILERSKKQYIKSLEWDVNEREIQLTRLWVNVMPKYSAHSFHIHPLSVISGTAYLQMPKQSPGLRFEDPRLAFKMGTPPIKMSGKLSRQSFIELKAKPGDLILFESWLRHEVPANKDNSSRISVSFNFDWVGN